MEKIGMAVLTCMLNIISMQIQTLKSMVFTEKELKDYILSVNALFNNVMILRHNAGLKYLIIPGLNDEIAGMVCLMRSCKNYNSESKKIPCEGCTNFAGENRQQDIFTCINFEPDIIKNLK